MDLWVLFEHLNGGYSSRNSQYHDIALQHPSPPANTKWTDIWQWLGYSNKNPNQIMIGDIGIGSDGIIYKEYLHNSIDKTYEELVTDAACAPVVIGSDFPRPDNGSNEEAFGPDQSKPHLKGAEAESADTPSKHSDPTLLETWYFLYHGHEVSEQSRIQGTKDYGKVVIRETSTLLKDTKMYWSKKELLGGTSIAKRGPTKIAS
jgi:hypothetical protein